MSRAQLKSHEVNVFGIERRPERTNEYPVRQQTYRCKKEVLTEPTLSGPLTALQQPRQGGEPRKAEASSKIYSRARVQLTMFVREATLLRERDPVTVCTELD